MRSSRAVLRASRCRPAAETQALVAAWPGAELMLTNSLGHRQVIWHPEVKARVAAFARQCLSDGEREQSLALRNVSGPS